MDKQQATYLKILGNSLMDMIQDGPEIKKLLPKDLVDSITSFYHSTNRDYIIAFNPDLKPVRNPKEGMTV